MDNTEPPFTVAIEEEYLLVDLDTRDVNENPPPRLLRACTQLGAGQINPEFLRSQLEVTTRVCHSVADARADLAGLRAIIVDAAGEYGLAPIAASTHPFANAMQQMPTEKEQFFALAREMRVMDCCTSIDDAVALAALVVCLVRRLYHLRRANQSWRLYPNVLIAESRWRAMRYSFDEQLLDLARGELVPFSLLMDELIAAVRADAEQLGCWREIEHLRTILARGTSAHRQIRKYEEARAAGASQREALQAVVDFLVRETASGLHVKMEQASSSGAGRRA